ncbi:MAG TPA: alpha/beta fold hydrolase [Paludibacter sp.]
MRYFGKNIKIIVNNLMISYTDAGPDDAPVIIFIHGFPLNKSMWNKQIEALKENYRVIAYDIRGHGDSEMESEPFSIDLFVKDLISFMDVLKIDKASLCGLSMGGYIALKAIKRNPLRFESLVLADTTCIADQPETIVKRKNAIKSIKEEGVVLYAEESVKSLFAPESLPRKLVEIAAVKEMIISTQDESICQTLRALSVREETCSFLSSIKIPVLVLVGEYDKITPPFAAAFIHKNIAGSKMFIIDHAGHLSNLENPDAFNDRLNAFFSTVYLKPEIVEQEIYNSFVKRMAKQLNIFWTSIWI